MCLIVVCRKTQKTSSSICHYIAYLENSPSEFGRGDYPAEAVMNFLKLYPDKLNLTGVLMYNNEEAY